MYDSNLGYEGGIPYAHMMTLNAYQPGYFQVADAG
jgi:hypothetical protein